MDGNCMVDLDYADLFKTSFSVSSQMLAQSEWLVSGEKQPYLLRWRNILSNVGWWSKSRVFFFVFFSDGHFFCPPGPGWSVGQQRGRRGRGWVGNPPLSGKDLAVGQPSRSSARVCIRTYTCVCVCVCPCSSVKHGCVLSANQRGAVCPEPGGTILQRDQGCG